MATVLHADYAVATARGLPLLRSSWIDACRERNALVENTAHRLLPFTGLDVSVTGLAQATRRTLEELVMEMGGQFCPDLRKSCTHLVAEAKVRACCCGLGNKDSVCVCVCIYVYAFVCLTHDNNRSRE